MDAENELKRLEGVASTSLYDKGVATFAMSYCFEVFKRHIRGPRILEMGPAEGLMTEQLIRLNHTLTVLEGSPTFCKMLAGKFPDLVIENSLFEDFAPAHPFDTIILGHVLEHVDDPVLILRRVGGWLSPAGIVLAAVPNARSLHRQAAVDMGILPNEAALNEMDVHHGHRRVYDPEALRGDFIAAGFSIEVFGGYWIKPLSNAQIEGTWTAEMVRAFLKLGERYPDIAAEIYVVAKLPDPRHR